MRGRVEGRGGRAEKGGGRGGEDDKDDDDDDDVLEPMRCPVNECVDFGPCLKCLRKF